MARSKQNKGAGNDDEPVRASGERAGEARHEHDEIRTGPAGGAGQEDDDVEDDDVEDEDVEDGDFDDELEDEFTLDQLSEAYAKVIHKRDGTESATAESAADMTKADKSGRAEPIVNVESDPEADDDAACPASPESILESILFVGGPKDVKLTSRNIAALIRDVSAAEITALAKKLNAKYEADGSAYRVSAKNGTMKIELHPDMIPVQNFMLGRYRAVRLSQQAIDVLAIVAYNQPVTRQKVDTVRTKPSGGIIRQMIRRGLVFAESEKGTPDLYRTSDRFLDLFGLDSIEDLPQSHDASGMDELAD